MIGKQTVVAVIPARGGSKGLPRKNILDLAGKPLIAWTIEAARACPYIDRLVLSSDDAEIMATARQWGCEVPFVRPKGLADDDASSMDVALHALKTLEQSFDYLVWLQPTSPLRQSGDISACLEICHQHQAPACVSVTEAGKSPYWMYYISDDNDLNPVMPRDLTALRRQELPAAFTLNGAVYVSRIDRMRQTRRFMNGGAKAYLMPADRSIDIDSELDFKIAALLLEKQASAAFCARDDPMREVPYPASALATAPIRTMACRKSSMEVANEIRI